MTSRTVIEVGAGTQQDGTLCSVTALRFFCSSTYGALLLAGEGSFLKIYDCNTTRAVSHIQIFSSQTIHGIEIHKSSTTDSAHVLIWGGYSVRTLRILDSVNIPPGSGKNKHLDVQLDDELGAPDWILDACFFPASQNEAWNHDTPHVSAALITAHNSLHLLNVGYHAEATSSGHQVLTLIGSSLRSILYSAHVICTSQNAVLVAAGTVFGEVLVWSCQTVTQPESHVNQENSKVYLHYTLCGHEGSVFGVRISPLLNFLGDGPSRLLASCSDDRTIRLWDVSSTTPKEPVALESPIFNPAETGFGTSDGNNSETPSGSEHLVAIGWGHSSRVWGVRFLPPTPPPSNRVQPKIELLSFGEDATCRWWSLQSSTKVSTPNPASFKGSLRSTQTFSLHDGKNIWSVDVIAKEASLLLSTGGADGKISLIYQPYCKDLTDKMCPYDREWTFEDIESSGNSHIPNNEVSVEDGPYDAPAQISQTHDVQDHLRGLLIKQSPTRGSETSSKQRKAFYDTFKSYAFLDVGECLFTTTQGKVFLGVMSTLRSDDSVAETITPVHEFAWRKIAELSSLRSYSVIASDTASKTAFLSGVDGTVYLFNHTTQKLQQLFQVPKKVSGLFPKLCEDDLYVVVTCFGSKNAYFHMLRPSRTGDDWIAIGPTDNPPNTTAVLELPDAFVTTSIEIVPSKEFLLLGSRSGALAVYDILDGFDSARVPVLACFRRVQGEDAVTAILSLPHSDPTALNSHILTSGRNGTYSVHKLHRHHTSANKPPPIALTTAHTSTLPFGPFIEGTHFHPTTNDLILWGFHSTTFIVWNESRAYEILRVECGGAHRAWAFSPSADGGGCFVWTKVSKLHLHTQFQDSHRVIQAGGHGREIKATAISPALPSSPNTGVGMTRHLIATGAEDTTIRICEYIPNPNESDIGKGHFRHLGAFKKHTTGIQHLNWSACGKYLFSSAGVEEFFVWKINQIPGFGIGVICEGACPVASTLPDLRIMGFAVDEFTVEGTEDTPAHEEKDFIVTMGFSDSTIKTYCYSTKTKEFALLSKGQYTTCCLTKVFHHWLDKDLYLITAATDGHIAIWCTPALGLENHNTKGIGSAAEIPTVSWHWRTPVHQSSIKSMLITSISLSSSLIITGGDDNALAFTQLHFSSSHTISSSTVLIPRAHVSAVTAIAQTRAPGANGRVQFVTSGNDQRVKVWGVSASEGGIGADGIEVDYVGSIGTSVADLSSLVVQESLVDWAAVVVAGVGMEAFKIRM